MQINGVEIEDTYAEAFRLYGARFIITASTREWAWEAARKATGFATSIIACGCEADVEREIEETPDGRPGVSCLIFASSVEELQKQAIDRIGQCVMTCPTTACFNGLVGENCMAVGSKLRYFGDGWQCSKVLGSTRYWRIPVMDGEFLVAESFGYCSTGSDGNFLILGENSRDTLAAATTAVKAMRQVPDIILPFPGGIVRSGSKVGSRYSSLRASTNTSFCPTLRGSGDSLIPDGVNCALEVVICGLDAGSVEEAMRVGVPAACGPGIMRITAGNYGGKLGEHKFYLHQLLTA